MNKIITVSFGVLFVYIAVLFFLFLRAYIANLQLFSYLKVKNYKRWCELTTIGRIGPGGSNPVRGMRYLRNDLDIDDDKILKYKHRVIIYLRYSLWAFLGIIVHCVLLTYLVISK